MWSSNSKHTVCLIVKDVMATEFTSLFISNKYAVSKLIKLMSYFQQIPKSDLFQIKTSFTHTTDMTHKDTNITP